MVGGRNMDKKKKPAYLKRLKRQTAMLLSAVLMAQGMVVNASFLEPLEAYEAEAVLENENQQGISENQLPEDMEELDEGMPDDSTDVKLPLQEQDSEKEDTVEGESISENAAGNELTEVKSPFAEDRYNPIYYGQVSDRWPVSDGKTSLYASGTTLSFEDYILKAINNFEIEVDVTAYHISLDDLWTEIYHVLNAHPELFYVTVTSAYTDNSTNTVVSYIFTYIGTKDTVAAETARFQNEANKAVAFVNNTMSDYEKALAIHDYIILNCEYDEENYNDDTVSETSHSAYGALVDKIAVCDGYAKAYQYIMSEKLGIDCQVVTSMDMGHAWSLIKIDGAWYHADLTWDDPVYDCIGRVYHEFFLLSDNEISDAEHQHYNWQVKDQNKNDITATSDRFSDWKWTKIFSGMFKKNNDWYYVKADKDGIVKDDDLSTESEQAFYVIDSEGNSTWRSNGCLARIMLYEDRIYFNTPSVIKSINLSGTDEKTEKVVNKTEDQFIYGFTIQNGNMKYALRNSQGAAEKQEVCTFGVAEASILSLVAKDYNSLDITLAKIEKQAEASSSGYAIYRKASWETKWTTAALLEGENNCYFRDGGLFDNTQYIYKVRNYQVINGDICYGPFSGEVTATTMKQQTVTPVPPTSGSEQQKKETAVKGKVYTVGNYKYKVTTVANGKTGKVTLVAPVKKTLTKVTVPSTVKIKSESYQVTAIEKNAFKNNKKISSVTIGKYVTTIGSNAFYGCKKLKKVSINSTRLKTIGKGAFKNIVKNAVIKVPKSKLKAYTKMFKKKTVGLPSKVNIKKG